MFHSDDNCTGQTIFDRTFLTDISPNSKQEDYPPLSLFHFPSPFFPYPEDENDVFLEHQHDLLPQQQQQQPSMNENTLGFNAFHPNKNMISDGSVVGCVKKQHTPTPVKRSSKKDRHSKINTAQGPRDRRMRLSLEIARKFFDLQDMLGFDKASRTVEWLLSKSKDAIEQVARDLLPPTGGTSIGSALKSTASSTSECEVLSGIDEMATIRSSAACVTNKEKKILSQAPKRAAFSALARQSRKKARARARERTKEKMLWSKRFKDHSKPLTEATMNNQGLNLVASGNESGNSQSHIPETIIEEIEEPSSHNMGDIVDNDSMVKFYWSPSSIFNHLHNTGISQEFTDFQFYGKTWDQIL